MSEAHVGRESEENVDRPGGWYRDFHEARSQSTRKNGQGGVSTDMASFLNTDGTSHMQRLPSIGSVRDATFTRFFAVVLIVLVALPFTAPFSTCDAAELAGDSSGHADASPDAKVCHEVRVGPIVSSASALLPLVTLVQHDGGLTARIGAQAPVLRL